VFFFIALMIAITVAIATFRLAPQMAQGRLLFATAPDKPAPFGYKMAWLAVRSRDTQAVITALGVVDPQPSNWNSGIGTVYDEQLGESRVFISPPVNGWTFVVGLPLPYASGRGFVDKLTPLLLGLGRQFIEVQYFFTYPLIDHFAWARVINGRLVRHFAIGDEGVIVSKGKTSQEERALGLKLFELRGVRGRKGDAGGELILHPTEDHVLRLAQRWSIDPTRLEAMEAEPQTGFIALAPTSWRTERMRKTA
jgi:hypothetical protein